MVQPGSFSSSGQIAKTLRQPDARRAIQHAFGHIADSRQQRARRPKSPVRWRSPRCMPTRASVLPAPSRTTPCARDSRMSLTSIARRFARLASVPSRNGSSTTLFSAVPPPPRCRTLPSRSPPLRADMRSAMRQIARKMIAADLERGRQLRRFPVVADQLRGMRADIDQRHALRRSSGSTLA